MDKIFLDKIIGQVSNPVRYMGNEYNMVEKDPDKVDIRFAFAFPDVYEVGMSHLGMKILYHLLNEQDNIYCERVFAPWVDMEDKMREHNIPLFALETKDPIKDFDFIGFTLQYEMCYTNIINMLDLAKVPLLTKDREEDDPLVIAGGPCAYNCEPVADLFDIVAMGEAEELILELMDIYKVWKNSGGTRDDFLIRAASIKGVYVPKFYDVKYKDSGLIESVTPNHPSVPERVVKRIVNDLDKTYYPEEMIVPYMQVVHDRVMLEAVRGCTRGCRFCQAGMIYRPVRERSAKRLLELAEKLTSSTGYEEVALTALSISDYSELEPLVTELMSHFKDKNISLSLPSMRLDSFSKEFIQEIQKVRRTGLTFAPEAGTQRLRDVINKGITEEDLINTVTDSFESGWSSVKLYFMIGLPTENDDDIKGIGKLVRDVKDCYYKIEKEKRPKGLRITVSTSSFVPKAFTPFQWASQDSMEVLRSKQTHLRKMLNIKNVDYNWHDPEVSFMEAVFAKGDRRLSKVLIKAWENGARFDGWQEHFDLDIWLKAFKEANIDPDFYAYRLRDKDEVFPWDHIDVGVSKKFLWHEYEKALKGELTPDCRTKCSGCGIRNTLGEGLC